MALQVWLPLDGDLRNQGISNVTVTNSGATVNDNGKIGKCYGTSTSGKITASYTLTTTSSFSISFWIKIPSTMEDCGSWYTLFYFAANNGSDRNVAVSWTDYNNIKIFDVNSHQCCWMAVEYDKWFHITITNTFLNDTNYLSVYKNGTLVNTYTRDVELKIRSGDIVFAPTVNDSKGPVYYNDVRIYDHCLTPLEIKEISQGLVLHYKLDDPYSEPTTNIAIYPTPGAEVGTSVGWDTSKHLNSIRVAGWSVGYNSGVSNPSQGYHACWKLIDGLPTMVFVDMNSSINLAHRWLGISGGIPSDNKIPSYTTYTVSFEARSDVDGKIISSGLYYRNSPSDTYAFKDGQVYINVSTEWKRYSYTKTTQVVDLSGSQSIYMYGHYEYSIETTSYVRNIQIEINDHATPYVVDNRNVEETINLNSNNWVPYGDYWTIESQTTREIKLRKNTSSSSATVALKNDTLRSKLSTNTAITVSGYLYKGDVPYKTASTSITTYNSTNTSNFESRNSGYFRYTFTFGTLESEWIIHNGLLGSGFEDGDICYIRNLQWELKDHPTPYTTSSRSDPSQNNRKICDSSGYGHHGSIIDTISLNQDTSRYNYSTGFNGTTSGVLIENLNIGHIINNAITYSFWIKPNGENGARSVYFGSYNATSFSIEKKSDGKLRLYWNGSPDITTSLSIVDDQWQHIVITKNGTSEIKVYLNGTLKQTVTDTFSDRSFPTTFRLGRDVRSNDGTPYKGLMSDFRIYSTVLSADDIKRLYNTSALIDKGANLECFETVENDSEKVDINKKGQTSIDSFVESDDYLYLPAGCYVDTELYYQQNDICKAETIIKYASDGSGRDLMGFSGYSNGYWGVTTDGNWESHGTFSYTNSDITKLNKISYLWTAYYENDHGNYKIGILTNGNSRRDKYIYNVKLYKNGVLERDLYPAHNASGNGLVDIIHNVFYQAVGSGTSIGNDGSKLARFYKGRVQLNQIIEI